LRYVRLFADADGASQFEDVEVDAVLRTMVENVPPVLVSGVLPAAGLTFVNQPIDAADWGHHVAPRRQWLILLRGRISVTVTSGNVASSTPALSCSQKDTEGSGHLSTPLSDDLQFVMIPPG